MRAPLALALLSACVVGGDRYPRPRDLAPAWLVDRPRILGIAADPPEARPGALVTVRGLLASPPTDDTAFVQVWLACALEEGGLGCPTDLAALDPEDPAALLEAGVIGIEPGFPPSWLVPTDFLDDLPAQDRAEGAYAMLQTTAIPSEVFDDPDALETLDPSALEIAYKRVVISLAETPNHNPVTAAWRVDGVPIPSDGVVHVQRRSFYDLGVELLETSIETYVYVNSDGVAEERVEEPYVAWFSTGGELQEEVTLFPYVEATWLSPSRKGAEGLWYAVIRDRRGGMAWKIQRWVVD